MFKLVSPSLEYQDSYLEALKEYKTETRPNEYLPFEGEEFKDFTERLISRERGENLPPGYIPETIWWLVDDGEYIGRVSFRHQLTDNLLKVGGHIGYDIRPSKRNLGYGTKLLKLCLAKIKSFGQGKILVTCDETNIASQKIIEKNGGVFENAYDPGNGITKKLRYWITL